MSFCRTLDRNLLVLEALTEPLGSPCTFSPGASADSGSLTAPSLHPSSGLSAAWPRCAPVCGFLRGPALGLHGAAFPVWGTGAALRVSRLPGVGSSEDSSAVGAFPRL